MSETYTVVIDMPVWFLWGVLVALYISVALAIVKAVLDWRLGRLKQRITTVGRAALEDEDG